jgi:hypothetical protein
LAPTYPIVDEPARADKAGRPGVDHKLALLRRHFLNRDDILGHLATWGKPCPVEAGEALTRLLSSHLTGVPVRHRWRKLDGTKSGDELGPLRLGTYSPAPDGRTRFACIDCDGGGHHGTPLKDPLAVALSIILTLQAWGLTCYLERSGSGAGWHVWVFFAEPVPAWKVRRLLLALIPRDAELAEGGYADAHKGEGLELFPKQDRIKQDGIGNQVWLPWWHGAAEGGNAFYREQDGALVPFVPDAFDTVSEATLDAASQAAIPGSADRQASRTTPPRQLVRGELSDRDIALSALAGLKKSRADGYLSWLKTGMMLYSVDQSGAMLAEWDNWSRCSDRYEEGACAKKWAGFSVNGVTVASLIYLAKQDGWRPPAPGRRQAAPSANGHAERNRQAPAASDVQARDGASLHHTDRGNGVRLAREHGEDLRHCFPWRKWLCWDGRRWRLDDTGEATHRAKLVVVSLFHDAVERIKAIERELCEGADQ